MVVIIILDKLVADYNSTFKRAKKGQKYFKKGNTQK